MLLVAVADVHVTGFSEHSLAVVGTHDHVAILRQSQRHALSGGNKIQDVLEEGLFAVGVSFTWVRGCAERWVVDTVRDEVIVVDSSS